MYAYDIAKQAKLEPTTQYFLKAVESVRENKRRYAEAEAQAALKANQPRRGLNFALMQQFEEGGSEG
jgi:hypothetical protein